MSSGCDVVFAQGDAVTLRAGLTLLALGAVAHAASLQPQIDAAAPGATIIVPAGIYEGVIVINKPLMLIGTGFPTIQGNGQGKVVQVAAEGVTLRGFRIRGSGLALFEDDAAVFVTADKAVIDGNQIEESLHGIYLKKANDCRLLNNRIDGKTTIPQESGPIEKGIGVALEDCAPGSLVANRRGNGIHQWNCERTEIAGNVISEARDGIYFSFTNHANVRGNTIHNVRYGLHYMYSDDNSFVGNTFTENAAGAALMFSKRIVVRENRFVSNRGFRAYGLIFQSMDDTRIENNVIEQNAVGLSFNQCNRNRITGNRVAQNYIGLRFGSNSDENGFSANAFTRNLQPVEMVGETGTNRWSLAGVGNYWDGAMTFDLDRDGINDLPHRELDLFGVLRRDFPAIAFLSESPAVKLLRFAHQRATLPGLNSIEDRASLTSASRLKP
ncbi:MAG: NosD domain-containing protein [Chthoniobacterales bacterium]